MRLYPYGFIDKSSNMSYLPHTKAYTDTCHNIKNDIYLDNIPANGTITSSRDYRYKNARPILCNIIPVRIGMQGAW
jgi:hypothetical protein